MSVPIVPMSLERQYDEEASLGEDSIYLTPEMSFTNSTCEIHTSSLGAKKWLLLSSPSPNRANQCCQEELLEVANDQENAGYSTPMRKSVHVPLQRHASTPLNCITNIATPVTATCDTSLSPKSIDTRNTKVDAGDSKSNNRNRTDGRGRRSFFQKLGIRRQSTTKCRIVKESIVPDVSLNFDDNSIVIRIPKESCGAVCCEKNLKAVNNDGSYSTQSLVDVESVADLSVSVLDDDRPTIIKPEKCWFRRLYPRRSVFNKFRLSPVKRLFTTAATHLYSSHEKYVKKLFKRKYEPLEQIEPFLPGDVENVNHNDEYVTINKSLIEQLSVKLDSVINIEQLMNQVVSKLDSLEAEVKELKSILKDNRSNGPLGSLAPLVPPPPPPPLPNFLNTGTPKRKADLTTPENDQVAKRPSRMVEQRAQFSITVEDLKNVKLRKIGNVRVTGGATVEKQSIRDISFHSATISKRPRRNRLSNKKDLSEVAAQLLLSPRKQKTDRIRNSMLTSNPNSKTSTPRNPVNSAYDETPVRTKRESSTFRSVKRKDWSGESPVRKRLNSGCSSPACYDSHSDTAE